MNRSSPVLPNHHQLPEITQTHVHRVGDVIQPSHPLLSPSPPAPIPPNIMVFSNESTLHIRWPKYWLNSRMELTDDRISELEDRLVEFANLNNRDNIRFKKLNLRDVWDNHIRPNICVLVVPVKEDKAKMVS